MPVVLPEMSSKLDESLFAVQAKMEKVSDWLDGINLLYVAFTRAVDALLHHVSGDAGCHGQRRRTPGHSSTRRLQSVTGRVLKGGRRTP